MSHHRLQTSSPGRPGLDPTTLGMLVLVALVTASVAVGQDRSTAGDGRADLVRRLVAAALERTSHRVVYDGSYRRIGYPGGDVPDSSGVCTDLVIRSYRRVGIDLQREVHEDMTAAFAAYPQLWGLDHPDPNIDHRRVPNLQTFFRRRGAALRVTSDPHDYRAGDLVTWRLPGNLPHIGLVSDRATSDGARPLIVHNIGAGPRLEDVLFAYPITGHFRYPESP